MYRNTMSSIINVKFSEIVGGSTNCPLCKGPLNRHQACAKCHMTYTNIIAGGKTKQHEARNRLREKLAARQATK